MAHKVDPSANLLYNDYGIVQKFKRNKYIKLIKSLQVAGVPIHGVGIQCHRNLESFDINAERSMLDDLLTLGLPIHISELDMSVYRRKDENNTHANGAPEDLLKLQGKYFGQLMELYKEYAQHIERVSLWGIRDSDSWKNDFPVKGRSDYATLIDREGNAKDSFFAMLSPKGYASLPVDKSALDSTRATKWGTLTVHSIANTPGGIDGLSRTRLKNELKAENELLKGVAIDAGLKVLYKGNKLIVDISVGEDSNMSIDSIGLHLREGKKKFSLMVNVAEGQHRFSDERALNIEMFNNNGYFSLRVTVPLETGISPGKKIPFDVSVSAKNPKGVMSKVAWSAGTPEDFRGFKALGSLIVE